VEPSANPVEEAESSQELQNVMLRVAEGAGDGLTVRLIHETDPVGVEVAIVDDAAYSAVGSAVPTDLPAADANL